MKKTAKGLLLAGVVIVAAALCLLLWPKGAPIEATSPSETLVEASAGLDDVTISADFDPVTRTLAVSQTLLLQNRTGGAQNAIVLRTYANAYRDEDYSPAATDELHAACYPDGFSEGSLKFQNIRLQMGDSDEQSATYAYDDDAHTVLRVALPSEWAAGAQATLRLEYTLTIPLCAHRFGENEGIVTLGNVFVLPSPFVDGEYLADAYDSIGDPFVSECRNYRVTLALPTDWQAAGSAAGVAGEPTAEGKQTLVFDAPAVRDFALTLSREYVTREAVQDGVLVRAFATTDSKAARLLKYAKQALSCFAARYGAYPYPTFTLSEVHFPFGGMEYPSLVMIASSYLENDNATLETLIAHETAHQWWYAVVGSDQFRQAWQDEALAEFSVLDYWETYYGKDARDELQFSRVETSMRLTIAEGVTPGSPVDYFGDLNEYTLVVYNRGAAALCALDTAMNGTLDEFLRAYYDTYAFRLATRADFETLLQAFTGEDWSPLLSDYLDTYINS